ncbi:hypothetical protein [Colwellia sp. TT2012]|uniref:hypothetical protein n=1 Tax=Colwellia sp. TT2012 TaxID=1720342 RepID=UPI000709E47E|nr:hypothetical protein [Colwellia sp. TT2012]
MDKVECQSCKANVVPRLWRIEGNFFFDNSHEHSCPICGELMYTSGGKFHFRGIEMVFSAIASLFIGMIIGGIFFPGGVVGLILSVGLFLFRHQIKKIIMSKFQKI